MSVFFVEWLLTSPTKNDLIFLAHLHALLPLQGPQRCRCPTVYMRFHELSTHFVSNNVTNSSLSHNVDSPHECHNVRHLQADVVTQ